eukprot:3647173-Prorocentrum_lima.AAC.1
MPPALTLPPPPLTPPRTTTNTCFGKKSRRTRCGAASTCTSLQVKVWQWWILSKNARSPQSSPHQV